MSACEPAQAPHGVLVSTAHPLLRALCTEECLDTFGPEVSIHPILASLGGTLGDLTPSDLASGNYGAAITTAASATGTQTALFNAEAITGTALNDASTASSLVHTFAQSGVDLTGQAGKQQTQDIAEGLMLIPGIGTALGAGLLAITNAVGFAHAGAGLCASSAPASPGLGDLKAWPNYTDWPHSPANGAPPGEAWTEGSDPPGSFEDLANRALAYNRALMDNCYNSLEVPPPILLAQIIASWNATHAGPPRMVQRRMTYGSIGSTAPGYDPISNALEYAAGLNGQVVSFPINSGPKIVHVALPKAPAASTASSSSAGTVVAVGAVGLVAGAAVWAGVTGRLAGLARWLHV